MGDSRKMERLILLNAAMKEETIMKESFTWRQALTACCLGILVAAFGVATPAYAVHDINLFELEGDALDDPAGGAGDWSTAASGTGKVFTGILPDPGRASGGNNVNDVSIFTTGGSKDVNDVSQWKYTSGSIPDKDDITNAYAIAYSNGQLIIYFGADRFANNGDAQIGFWFFQQDVRLGAGGKFTNGVGGPVANHTDGDLLILADFTQGGTVGTIKVYEWLGGADGHLNLTPSFTGTTCNGGGDSLCAIENDDPTAAFWSYTPKFGTTGTFPQGAFFEGGINVSAIFGGVVPCFASFLAETRSSQSPTAQLKDFVLGGFPVCGVGIGKTCDTNLANNPSFNPDTNLVHTVFNVPVTNTGLGTIYDVTIAEGANSILPSDAAGSQCSLTAIGGTPVGPISLLVKGGTPVDVPVADSMVGGAVLNLTVECDSSQNPMTNTITVKAKSAAESSVFSVPPAQHTTGAGETCSLTLQTGMTLDKNCKSVTMIGGVVPEVCVDITVTNTSNQDLRITSLKDYEAFDGAEADVLNLFLTANGNSDVLQQAGAAGASAIFTRCYTPVAIDNTPQNPGSVFYPDHVLGSGVGVFDGSTANTTDIRADESCPLCPQP